MSEYWVRRIKTGMEIGVKVTIDCKPSTNPPDTTSVHEDSKEVLFKSLVERVHTMENRYTEDLRCWNNKNRRKD